jgi:hypothetical protein
MSTIPEHIEQEADAAVDEMCRLHEYAGRPAWIKIIARALLAAEERGAARERAHWRPAITYFERYCQDEAEDNAVEFVGCSQQQHEDAKAFAAATRK